MTEAPLKATLKAGRDYDAPWLTIEASTPDELKTRLEGIIEPVIPALIEAANALKAANNLAPLLQNGADAASQPAQAPQGGGGWSNPPQQQSAPQQQAPQQSNGGGGGGWQANVQLHPEGLACHCGEVLQFGKTRTNKGQWKCPGYRWNNGNPNEHRLEWAN